MWLLIGLLACLTLAASVSSQRVNPFSLLFARARRWIRRARAVEPVQVDRGWTVIPGHDDDAFRNWIHQDDFKHPKSDQLEPSLGCHLLIEFYGCDRFVLEQEETVRDTMEEAARRSSAQIVTSSFHEFKPFGVSGAVIIQESHYTIHTWPEHLYAAVDLFYCSEGVDVDKAVEALQERLKPTRTRFLLIRRGLQSEVGR